VESGETLLKAVFSGVDGRRTGESADAIVQWAFKSSAPRRFPVSYDNQVVVTHREFQ
jgi:hypothetical protein